MKRAWAIVACLTILAAGLTAPPIAHAADGLVLSSHTRYDVRPETGTVAVSVDIVATNVIPDDAQGRTYFTGLSVPIPSGATAVSAFGSGVPLRVSVTAADEFVDLAEVTFASGVFYQQSARFRLSFTIVDGGGDPTRATWVRSSFVAFVVWAIGSDGPTTVEVVLPPGFLATDPPDEFEITADATATRLLATGVEPTFGVYLSAERESARTSTRMDVRFADSVGRLELLAWPDDPEWTTRLGALLGEGFPVLEDEIGVAYAYPRRLQVREHAYQHLGEYGGYFSWAEGAINVRFDADAFLTLHEAAHLWFNEGLTNERWVNEGFASYYAEVAGGLLGEELETYELTDDLDAAAFPLTEWGDPFAEDPEREDYGYAASHAAARDIAAIAGPDGLRAVWIAAMADRRAYGLVADEELEAGEWRHHEWQRYLDLFEIETGHAFVDTWERWIIDERDRELLDDRAEARAAYAATTTALEGWVMPLTARMAMEWWEFDDAMQQFDEIAALVDRRTEIADDAATLGLDPTDDLRQAFEGEGVDAAAAEAAEQVSALESIASTTPVVDAELSALEHVGLVGEPEPALELAAARAAYEAGDDGEAVARARAAAADRAALEDRGRTRVVAVGGSILLLDLGALGLLVARRRRGRQRSLPA